MYGIQPYHQADDGRPWYESEQLGALVAQIGGTDAAIAALADAIRRESELEVMRSRGEL